MQQATAAGGVCALCTANTGDHNGCAEDCPVCVNVLQDYLSSCQLDASFESLNYETLEAYSSLLTLGSDCWTYFQEVA
jgi:hypothetical protein